MPRGCCPACQTYSLDDGHDVIGGARSRVSADVDRPTTSEGVPARSIGKRASDGILTGTSGA